MELVRNPTMVESVVMLVDEDFLSGKNFWCADLVLTLALKF